MTNIGDPSYFNEDFEKPPCATERMTIGPYEISKMGDNFWIRKEGGEGMETSKAGLVLLLANLWETEF